ncbi:hypothetical protein V6N13_079313 [Hibiscus sabdariffa]
MSETSFGHWLVAGLSFFSTSRTPLMAYVKEDNVRLVAGFLQDHGGLPHALPLAGRYGTKFKYQKQVGGRIQSTLLLYGL